MCCPEAAPVDERTEEKEGEEKEEEEWDEDMATKLRLVLEDVLQHVRFPLLSSKEVSMYVSPTLLLDQQQTIELFTFLASKESNVKDYKLAFPTSSWLSSCKAHPRRGREAPLLFKFDNKRKAASITISGDNGLAMPSCPVGLFVVFFGVNALPGPPSHFFLFR